MRENKAMSKFTIIVLGSGTMVPTKERNSAGFLVEIANKTILIDAGHGIIRRMVDLSINIQDIDIVFISHFHTDHFGDAFNLIHTRWVDDMYHKRPNKKLIFIGPNTIEKRYRQWRKIFWPEPNEFYPVYFKEGANKYKFGQVEIETFPIIHVKWLPSVGIIVKFAGKKLIYTGDVGSKHNFKDLLKMTRRTNLLITEAYDEKPTPNHYTIQQIKELAHEAEIKKILVVHVRPQHLKKIKQICQNEPNFILGKDGLKLKI